MNASHRIAWLLAVSIALALVTGAALALFQRAPAYGGRSVRSWDKLLWAGTPAEQTKAAQAFRSMGTNAAPELARMLRQRDPMVRTRLFDVAEKQTLVRYPNVDRDIDQQRIALKAAGVLGESARPLVPVLQDLIRNWQNESVDIVQDASRIAKALAPESTPELTLGSGPPHLVYPTPDAGHP